MSKGAWSSLAVCSLLAAPQGAVGYPLDPRVSAAGRDELGLDVLVAAADVERLLAIPGLTPRSCASSLCTAHLAGPSVLDDPALEDVLVALEPSHRRRPQLDLSLAVAGVQPDWPELGVDGSGVIVAVIDSGLDFRHPDFQDDQGRTRVLYLVDLSEEPVGLVPEVEERIGAAVFRAADIDAALEAERSGQAPVVPVTERDTYGHGTHVTAVAAGRNGVAPAASIVAVRASRQRWPVAFEDADILDAARLVFELADELGRPCVLLLALGGHEGGHDGSSLLEIGLADLVSGPSGDVPGRSIVVAAGNSGGCRDHARAEVTSEATAELALDVGRRDESLEVDLEIWYRAPADLSVALETPSGLTVGPAASSDEWDEEGEDGRILISNPASSPRPGSPERRALVSLRAGRTASIAPGRFTILVRGHGSFEAYLSQMSDERPPAAAALATALDPDGTLTVPATAPALIAVGATVSRAGWTDQAGRLYEEGGFRPGDLASYSGSGPTRSGALKPDLVAPGHAVLAALSRDAEPPSPYSVFTPTSPFVDDRYCVAGPGDVAVLSGTSVAAAHVAGIVALLLQRDPSLDQRSLRSILISTARTERGAAGRAWSPRWGFGEVDAARALALLDAPRARPPAMATSSLGVAHDVVAPAGCTTVTAVPRAADGMPVGPGAEVTVRCSAGRLGAVVDQGDGVYLAELCAAGLPAGQVIEVTASLEGVELGRAVRVHVARGRASLGALATAGGGCDASRARAMPAGEPCAALLRLLAR